LVLGWQVIQAVTIGSIIGTLANIILGGPEISTPYHLIGLPLAVLIALYLSFLRRIHQNGLAVSCTIFSALFVQLVPFAWNGVLDDLRFLWAKTLVVRLVAVITAVLAATFANAMISCCCYQKILQSRLRYIERDIFRSLCDDSDGIAFKPATPQNRALYGLLQEFETEIAIVRKEQGFRDLFCSFGAPNPKVLEEIDQRRILLETVVGCHAFVGFQLTRPNLSNEERTALKQLATWLRDKGTEQVNPGSFPGSLHLIIDTLNSTLALLAQGETMTETTPLLFGCDALGSTYASV